MNNQELNKWFQQNFPKMVQDMELSNHHYSLEYLNPYHLESNVFVHVQMACLMAEMINASINSHIAVLLHDIGKPLTRKENHDKKRVSMINHEAVSAFMSIEVLEKLSKVMNLSVSDKINIFFAICYHIDFHKVIDQCKKENSFEKFIERYAGMPVMAKVLVELGIADSLGRFTDESISTKDKTLLSLMKEMEEKNVFELLKNKKNKIDLDTESPTIELLIGLPASGKSTYRESISNTTIICRDDYLTDYGKYDYRESFNTRQSEANKLLDQNLKKAFKNKDNVLVDMTNLVKSRRTSLLNQAKGYKKIGTLFLEELPVIEERNLQRGSKFISYEVYKGMMESFTLPSFEEFDVINIVYKGQKIQL